MGFDFGIIDDPIKNRKEANSPTVRQSIWDWFASTFYTRQESNARKLVTLTPWHPDDLAGRLLQLAQDTPAADQWHVLRFPAIADETIGDYDPREPGEALWPGKYDADALAQIRATVGEFEWNALYQCRPRIPEGSVVKREWFDVVDAVPSNAQWVRYWDKAGTDDAGAYSAGVLMGRDKDTGHYYIADVVRGQWSAGMRERMIKQTAQLDDARYGRVRIMVEQEPGSGGKESAQATVRNLAGFNVRPDRPTGDKPSRFYPFAAQAEIGDVKLIKGAWVADWLFEVCAFPDSTYEDQVDATSGAFNGLTRRRGGGNIR
jgi:predicted phage terminase large subunit-like protein